MERYWQMKSRRGLMPRFSHAVPQHSPQNQPQEVGVVAQAITRKFKMTVEDKSCLYTKFLVHLRHVVTCDIKISSNIELSYSFVILWDVLDHQKYDISLVWSVSRIRLGASWEDLRVEEIHYECWEWSSKRKEDICQECHDTLCITSCIIRGQNAFGIHNAVTLTASVMALQP